MSDATPSLSFSAVRQRLLERSELALLDLREEDPYAQEHPLWAANLPLSRLELDVWRRIPRRDTCIVLYGEHAGVDLVAIAAPRLRQLGYTHVHRLDGDLTGWRAAGGELFRDVNVPSKAFGELVEHVRHTPSLAAPDVKALIEGGANVVVLDARRFDEYQTMSIPSGISVPGAELVLRARELAPDPSTQIIVNCAGRTRSIIGTQSLVNAGLPNPIAALRNGTIGWKLAGQTLDHGAAQTAPAPSPENQQKAAQSARAVAEKAGAQWLSLDQLAGLKAPQRTLYLLDVRTPEEYAAGHLEGFSSAPGGQLVQETDHHAPVRGARLVLTDTDGVRAPMTASWLAQMGWETWVLEAPQSAFTVTGPEPQVLPPLPEIAACSAQELAELLATNAAPETAQQKTTTVVIDVSSGVNYVRQHIPGAWFAIRAQLPLAMQNIPLAARHVLTCTSGNLARFAVADLRTWLAAQGLQSEIRVLAGGNAAWYAADLPTESGETRLAVPRTDRYRRPYEGTDAPVAAMQGYLDWEFGLVGQLGRDGTHHFNVL